FEILRVGSWAAIFCSRRFLREAGTLDGMHSLKLVLAREFQDHASGVAFGGLRSLLLNVNVPDKGGGAQQVPLRGEQEFSLIGAGVNLRSLLGRRRFFGQQVSYWLTLRLPLRLSRVYGNDVAFGQHALDIVVGAEIKSGVIGLHRAIFAAKMRMIEHDLARIVGDDSVFGFEGPLICAA